MTTEMKKCLAEGCRLGRQVLDQLAFNEKMAELGRVAASLVHELNTPLSVIVSATQLIQREEGVPAAVAEMVDRIGEEAQRLSRLTRGIMSFGRPADEDGEEADVAVTLQEVLMLIAYEVSKRSVRVVQEIDADVPSVMIPSDRLKQVFLNLFMNALHVMEEGGTLTVAAHQESERVAIRVQDTGCGIPQSIIGEIFEPFFTTRGKNGGTGLGLYVAKTLIEAAEGSIAVESRQGRGTTFTLRLQAATGSAAA